MGDSKENIILDPYKVHFKKIKDSKKFRPAALTFEKNGYYTTYPEGTSAYIEFWKEEKRRCKYGYTTEDGDFLSGYFYFYLNYCPITLDRYNPKTKRIERVQGFPKVYDYDWYYFDAIEEAERTGKHLVVIKKRGAGYSFKGGSMLDRNYYHFPRSKSYAIAEEMEFLLKDGLLSKAWDFMDFIDQNTAWGKKRQKKNSTTHRRSSYEIDIEGKKIERGYKSEIIGVSLKNDAQKARGKRGKLILWEEAGKFRGLKTAWQVARPSVEGSDGKAFGLMIAYGTGGTEEAEYESLRDLFYEPDVYNCLPIENVWDEGADKACGFFVPQYYNMGDGFMDENGNSLVKEAIKSELEKREVIIKNASDRNTIDRYCAEKPFTPQEATLELSSNIFPKAELQKQLAFIRTNQSVRDQKQVGELVFNHEGVLEWKQSELPNDITKYRLDRDKDNKNGSIVIWEHPVDDPPYGLYIGGCLTPGEKVVTTNGLKNVEDVTLEDKLINKDGEEVGINTLLRYDKEEEKTYRVKMSNIYRTTNFTSEHPLYLSNTPYNSNNTINEEKFDFEFIRMKNVKKGQWTKYPNYYRKEKLYTLPFKWNPNWKISNDPEALFWWVIGYWLGDGWTQKDGSIYFSVNKEEKYYASKIEDFAGLINRSYYVRCRGNVYEYSICNKQLAEYLENTYGKYADGKSIPEWVKYIPNKYKSKLIQGYLDSDGCITHHTKGYISTEFVSVSQELLEGIQDILFSMGVISSMSKLRNSKISKINNREVHQKETYHLRISHHSSLDLVNQFYGFYDHTLFEDHKLKKINFKNLPEIRKRPKDGCFFSEDKNYIYLQIKEIEESLYTGIVYNFDCETHTFVSPYCSTHNCDPYDHDKSGTNSLGSTFIYKKFYAFDSYYDIIVAEYTGRPETAEEYYENVRKLLIYYNATLLYENEKKGIFQYFETKNCSHLLADQPSIINDIVQNSKVERKKGVHAVVAIQDWAEGQLKSWLLTDRGEGKLNLHTILSEPLLEELILFNDKGNFDRVIALMMVMIYKAEMHKLKVKEKTGENNKRKFLSTPLFNDI